MVAANQLYFSKINFFRRGPNKYTRSWEDVDAYSKPTRGRILVRGGKVKDKKMLKTEEMFPLLTSRGKKINVLN